MRITVLKCTYFDENASFLSASNNIEQSLDLPLSVICFNEINTAISKSRYNQNTHTHKDSEKK